MTGRWAATSASAIADTDFGSGPLFRLGAFLYSATSASGTSSRRMSVGNSTNTGPAVSDRREGAAQRLDRGVSDGDLLGQLGDVAEIQGRVEVRVHLVDVAGITGR